MHCAIRPAALATVVLLSTVPAFASGYRIPEQSVNSVARAGGYVAHTPGVDSASYNPANMGQLSDQWHVEGNATWIHLPAVTHKDWRSGHREDSKEEHFLMPTLFLVSPEWSGWRAGFSLTAPGGLSKRWRGPLGRASAEEFTLKIFEANPVLSYRISDRIAVGAGVRFVYTDGLVTSNANNVLTRHMEGDSLDMGYNLALTVRPLETVACSVTYRSRVDLGLEGDARLTGPGGAAYTGPANIEIPLPAVLSVGAAWTVYDPLTVEISYDRTYWSDYKSLDFNYPAPLRNPFLYNFFDRPILREWTDTDAWRISMEYRWDDRLTLMAGFAWDESPASEERLGFELPDSDALIYSLGFRYRMNERWEMGLAYLYDDKKTRNVTNETIEGSFSDSGAHLVTFGLTCHL
ncbi:MAG: OmpP1/FadL family transporter [Desulfobulbus sp.]|jgi:long-chain fatty acid transport protein